MNDNGYVYVLMNPSMPNLVKIGKTKRKPEERAKELSATTGVPTPFTVVYDNYFEDCSKAEQHVHILLENRGYRVSKNREFFEIPIKDAINVVMDAKKYFGEFKTNNTEKNIDESEYRDPWEDILEMAENIEEIAEGYEHGTEDYIQNYNDAITYYSKAIRLGYKHGYINISFIYNNNLEDKKNTFKYLEKGIKDGCIDCYAVLGFHNIFINFEKAKNNYELYMKYISEEELSLDNMCDYLALSVVAIDIYTDINEIKYFSKMLAFKNKILKYFSEKEDLFSVYYTYKYNYESFYDLPSYIKNAIEKKSEENSSCSYILSSYSAEYRIEKDAFIDYLKLIFESGYVSPDDFKRVICTLEVEEI